MAAAVTLMAAFTAATLSLMAARMAATVTLMEAFTGTILALQGMKELKYLWQKGTNCAKEDNLESAAEQLLS
jgi:hypothetical protein